jgi:hypothetical protein
MADFITVPELPKLSTIPNDAAFHLVVGGVDYYGTKADFIKDLDLDALIFRNTITPTSPAPTLPGIYPPEVNGTYTNYGGFEVDLSAGVTTIYFDGTSFTKQVVPIDLSGYLTPNSVISKEKIEGINDFKLPLGNLTNGFYLSNGSPLPLESANYTEFISVSPNTSYTFVGFCFAIGGTIYDINQIVIDNIIFTNAASSEVFTTNGDTYFLKLNIKTLDFTGFYKTSEYYKKKLDWLYIDYEKIINNPTQVSNFDYSTRNVNTFIGATNFVIDALLAVKPKARFIFITHHTEDGSIGNKSLIKLIEQQIGIANYWATGVLNLSQKLNWMKKGSKNTLISNVPDELHPGTDTTYVSTNRIKREVKKFVQFEFDSWTGKRVAWYGTSIPAGFPEFNEFTTMYPNLAINELGGIADNRAESGSTIRKRLFNGDPVPYSSFLDLTNPINYQTSMVNLIGTANEPDLFVFDFGINDFNADNSDFTN